MSARHGKPVVWPAGHLWSTDWNAVTCVSCLLDVPRVAVSTALRKILADAAKAAQDAPPDQRLAIESGVLRSRIWLLASQIDQGA